MPGRKIFDASFAGARTKLANAYTVCEYDGTVDSSGNLVDVTNTHLLTVEGTPTSELSGILQNDGKVWESRVLAGTDRYVCAHHDDFNMLAGDFTATVIWKLPSPFGGGGGIFGNYDAAADTGLYLFWVNYGGGPEIYCDVGAGGSPLETPSMSVSTCGTQQICQVVKEGDLLHLTVNGVRSPAIDVSTGIDSAVGFALGDIGNIVAGAWPLTGSITYFRLDSCAYKGYELAFQRGVLLGHALGTHNKTIMHFRRDLVTSVLFSGYSCVQGRLYKQAVDAPRIEDAGLLIEEERINHAWDTEDLSSMNWIKLDTDTISVDGAEAPTGEMTMDGIIASVNNTTHGVEQQYAPLGIARQIYLAISCYAKAGTQSWLKISSSQDATRYVYFNVAQGRVGTIGAGIDATSVGMAPMANGIWRCYFKLLYDDGDGGSYSMNVAYSPAASDGVVAFAGNGVDVSMWLWGFSHEIKGTIGDYLSVTHPTSYFPTGTRPADDFTLRPFVVETNFGDYPLPEWQTDLTSDFAHDSTFTMNGRAFTQSGDILVKYMSQSEKCLQSTISGCIFSDDAAFNKSGAFSICVFYTPEKDNTDAYIGYLRGAGTNNGWGIMQTGRDIRFYTTIDGGVLFGLNKVLNCTYANMPLLITVYYDGVDTSYLYVNDYPVSVSDTHSMVAPYVGPAPQFVIGGPLPAMGGSYLIYESLIHGCAIYSEQLGQAFHDARYAQLKKYGFFPDHVSSTTEKTKLRISFEAQTLYKAGATESATGARHFVSLSGNNGVSSSDSNNLRVYFDDSQYFTTYFCDDILAANAHYFKKDALLNVALDHSHNYDVEFDCADLSDSALKVDGSAANVSSTLMAGTADFIALDTLMRVGQSAAGVVDGNLHIKDVKIFLGS